MFIFTKEILNGKVHFCTLICASRQKTIVKKKITYYLKNYFAYLFTIFEKSLQFAIFLPLSI